MSVAAVPDVRRILIAQAGLHLALAHEKLEQLLKQVAVQIEQSPAAASPLRGAVTGGSVQPATPGSPAQGVPAASVPGLDVSSVQLAPAVAVSARPAPFQLQLTPARKELLRELYPTETPTQEIHRRLNLLPGPTVAFDRVAIWASKLGLRRPAGAQRSVVRSAASKATSSEKAALADQPARSAVTQAPPPVAKQPEKPQAPKAKEAAAPAAAQPKWSDARKGVVREHHRQRPAVEIAALCNRLPGPPVSGRDVLQVTALMSLPEPPLPENADPIETDLETIAAWAGPRGIAVRSPEDLAQVNRKCRDLGLRQFKLVRPPSSRR